MDRAQVPGSVAQPQFGQVAEPGGNLKANALQSEGAIAAALEAPDLGGKGDLQLVGGRTGLGHVFVIKKALQRSLADLRVNLAVILQLDPRLTYLVELVQRQIDYPLERKSTRLNSSHL